MDKKAIIKALRDTAQSASNMAASSVSGPVDMIASGLRAAGLPIPQNAVGGSRWMEQQGLSQPVEMGAPRIIGETLGLAGPAVVMGAPAQVAAALRKGGENLAARGALSAGPGGSQKGAIVWHGSPHKFDRFDASKIGTGEGAQAYGHGLYLAESPDVAVQYAKGVSGVDGPTNVAYKAIGAGSDPIDTLKMIYPNMPKSWYDSAISKASQISGNTYKVDLPDEQIARMLDWDKPLVQQSAGVQRFFQDYSRPPGADTILGDWLKPRISEGSMITDDLAKEGIPGIRYLDGFSRGSSGTSNFVVFPGNESMLKILERNGQPLGMFGAP